MPCACRNLTCWGLVDYAVRVSASLRVALRTDKFVARTFGKEYPHVVSDGGRPRSGHRSATPQDLGAKISEKLLVPWCFLLSPSLEYQREKCCVGWV